MSPFEPTGDQARWRTLYALLQGTEVDSVLTYDDMAHALELDPLKDRHTIQMSMRRAARELELCEGHAVDAVTNEGYRVVRPQEHLTLARRHQKRSSRALKAGHSKVVNVDMTGVEPEVQKAFHVVATAFSMQMEFNRRLDVRQKRLEDSMHQVVKRTDRTDDEVSELRARLERLERAGIENRQ